MTRADRRLVNVLELRTRKLEPALRAAYLSAVQALAKELGTEAVIEKIRTLKLDEVVTEPMLDRAFLRLRAELRREAEIAFRFEIPDLRAAAGAAAGSSPAAVSAAFAPGGAVSFNVLNPRVATALENLDRTILRAVKDEARQVVIDHLQNALASGVSGIQAARGLRDVIGLTPTQSKHVSNFRNKLERIASLAPGEKSPLEYGLRDRRFDSVVKKARAAKADLSPAQVDRMVDAYRKKYVAWHGQTIARTATLNAYTQGQKAAYASATDAGIFPESRTTKRWVTVGDARVRPEHVAMNGETVALDAVFSNGLDVPSEWNCRCRIRYEIEPIPAAGARRRPVTPPPAPAAGPTRPPRAPRVAPVVRPPATVRPAPVAPPRPSPAVVVPPPPPPPYVSPWGAGRAKALDDSLRRGERRIRGLNYEEADVVAADGTVLVSKKGAKSSVSFSNAEVALMKDAHLTHNHPSGGYGFSKPDWTTTISANLAEMRSVTRDGQVSSVLRPAGGWNVTEAQVVRAYNKYNKELLAEYGPKVQAGTLNVAEANRTHYREVAKRIANSFGWTFNSFIDPEP